jgi:hypothetical protein
MAKFQRDRIGMAVTVGTTTTTLTGSATWNPPSVASGAATTTTVTVSGATVGARVDVSLSSMTTAAQILSGDVTSANTVRVVLFNCSGGAVDLASGTLRVWVVNP